MSRLRLEWGMEQLATHWEALRGRVDQSLLPRGPRARPAGCGSDGCVWETRGRRWVMKLTSEPSEAEFATAAHAVGPWPDGIVKYRAAARVGDCWAIWREPVRHVGGAKLSQAQWLALAVFRQYAGDALLVADRVRSKDGLDTRVERMRAELPPKVWNSLDISRATELGLADRLAFDLAACREIAQQIGRDGRLRDVGRALEFYMLQGIVLADVHDDNLGLRKGGVVITDTGRWLHLPRPAPARGHAGSDPSLFIALYPSQQEARELAASGTETPARLHVTLAYIGRSSQLPPDAIERAARAVAATPWEGGVLRARTAGLGRFPEQDNGKQIVYVRLATEDIPRYRHRLIPALRAEGLTVNVRFNFKPHITMGEAATGAPWPYAEPSERSMRFRSVWLNCGSDVRAVPIPTR